MAGQKNFEVDQNATFTFIVEYKDNNNLLLLKQINYFIQNQSMTLCLLILTLIRLSC